MGSPRNLSQLATPKQPAVAPCASLERHSLASLFWAPLHLQTVPACSVLKELTSMVYKGEHCLSSCLRSTLLGESWKQRGGLTACPGGVGGQARSVAGTVGRAQGGASVCLPVIPIPGHALKADSSWEVQCCHLVCGLLGPLSQILRASAWHP